MRWIIWLVLFIAFVVVELSTVQLVSIWFAIGCIGAGIANIVTDGQSFVVELITFVLLTTVSLLATRPFVRKVTHTGHVATNADSLIGATAVVSEKINNVLGTGAVTIKGAVWTARTEFDADGAIDVGENVEIIKIDGVKLIVKSKKAE